MRDIQFEIFNVNEADDDLYEKLGGDSGFPLIQKTNIFLLAACIGFYYDKREPLTKPKGVVRRSSVLNVKQAQAVYDSFLCLAFHNHEMDEEGNVKVKEMIEEYANGGFHKLWSILKDAPNTGDALANHVMLYLNAKDSAS